MSERGLGAPEREALERTRARLIAVRVEHFRLLEDVAELERLGVAEKTGDRSTGRLLQEPGLLDAPEATRRVEEAADLTTRTTSGTGSITARRVWTTWCCCAATTTSSSTTVTGPW